MKLGLADKKSMASADLNVVMGANKLVLRAGRSEGARGLGRLSGVERRRTAESTCFSRALRKSASRFTSLELEIDAQNVQIAKVSSDDRRFSRTCLYYNI